MAEPGQAPQPAGMSLERGITICTEAARERDPRLEVHGIGHFVALGEQIVGVAVHLPHAPHLVACLEDLPSRGLRSSVPHPPGTPSGTGSVGFGGFAVDMGGPRPELPPTQFSAQVAQAQAQLRALVRKLVTHGVLSASDPAVRELLDGVRRGRPT